MGQKVSSRRLGETSQRSNEVMENDPTLEPKHKIFLSHSGAQKEFVDHLCKALEDQFYYPFFDRRHESLPKGERFPKLIVRAAQQCEMLIVVVSDEYFMSKWPMIELSAFVQAHKLHCESKNSTFGPKILPLFYGLSVDDLEDATLQKKWFEKWDTLAKSDPRINVEHWKHALIVLKSFNGLPYDKKLKEVVAYEEKIVSCVCKSILPEIRWDDSHVQGKSNICEVIGEKIEGIGISKKYNVKVVGLYGVGGIGKTTTCKTLINELMSQYEGRTCHIEFPSGLWSDSKEFFQKVLQDLTRKSVDVVQHLNEGQCKDILCKNLFKKRAFLAIDNISDTFQSMKLAKTILELPYHIDSVVVVTARSKSVLELLGINKDACLEMPDLGEVDAVKLFLHHAIGGKEFFEKEEKYCVLMCVRRCYFSKGNGQGHHYHPLALQALGLQLGCYGENPSLWMKHLPSVRAFNYLFGGNPVFDILRSGFDLLLEKDQTLFMDVGCFLYNMSSDFLLSLLCNVHEEDEGGIILRMEHLKRKGLLEHVDMRSNKVTMHDLYVEFIELQSKGSFNKMSEQMWINIENGDLTRLKYKPQGGCWHKLTRLHIKHVNQFHQECGGSVGQSGSLKGIKWEYFANVGVLLLDEVHLGHGTLNFIDLVCLRVLKLHYVRDIKEIEGLGELKDLTHFEWFLHDGSDSVPVRIVGQLPSSLKLLEIWGLATLASDALVQCHDLVKLELRYVEALSLDLGKCRFLESAALGGIKKLQTLLGLATHESPCLQSLTVLLCKDLVDLRGVDRLTSLKKLHTDNNLKCEVPSLLALTELQVLNLCGNGRLAVHADDSIPSQLRELRWRLSKSSKVLNLHGFNLLEVLDLSYSDGLTSLAELGDLPALRCLDLGHCKHLVQLPNLSKSRNLEELSLRGCLGLILEKRDIRILSKLPLLQPVPFRAQEDEADDGQHFRLDLRRRKLVMNRTLGLVMYKQQEQDLGPPPMKIGNLDLKQLGFREGALEFYSEAALALSDKQPLVCWLSRWNPGR